MALVRKPGHFRGSVVLRWIFIILHKSHERVCGAGGFRSRWSEEFLCRGGVLLLRLTIALLGVILEPHELRDKVHQDLAYPAVAVLADDEFGSFRLARVRLDPLPRLVVG